MERMKIAYLLESMALCGGVKVVLRQAEALLKRGHHAVVISPEEYPPWFEGRVLFKQGGFPDGDLLKGFDRIIGTTPRLVLSVYGFPEIRGRLRHLVQGYEGDYRELQPMQGVIDEAYSLPVPKLTVSESLAVRLGNLYPGCSFVSVGQGVEGQYFYPAPRSARQPAGGVDRVFLIGPLGISIKQIHLGLQAYRRTGERYPSVGLVRISAVDTRAEEEVLAGAVAGYHVHATPREVAEILRSGTGIFLSPSSPGEGFGLPALEALASGVPAVLTDIPSYRTYSDRGDFALFVPHDDPGAMAGAICRLVEDTPLRERLIRRGLEVAARFSFDRVAEALERELGDGSPC
jgi:glycosyltransferase involved in cell wall biosynthesis